MKRTTVAPWILVPFALGMYLGRHEMYNTFFALLSFGLVALIAIILYSKKVI